MKTRSLVILAAALILLAGAAVLRHRGIRNPAPRREGGSVLAGFDVNRVSGLTVSRGERSARIGKEKDLWVVKSLYDYPADFSRLAAAVRKLAEAGFGFRVPRAVPAKPSRRPT